MESLNNSVLESLELLHGEENIPRVATWTDRYLQFMESEEHSDIVLYVGKDKVPIKAHRMILIFGSPYFELRLAQKAVIPIPSVVGEGIDADIPDVEKQANPLNSLVIEEVEPSDFQLFVKFLYSGIYPTNVEEALPLMNCASIFDVPSLSVAAGNLLKATLSPESAPTIFQQAIRYNNLNLLKSASDFICRYAYKTVNVAQFGRLTHEALGAIIKRDDVRVYDEMQIFDTVMSWAKEECIRQKMDYKNPKYVRSVIEPLLKFIRFPQMSASEFSLKVARLKILTSDEIVDIWPYFALTAAQRSTLPSELFTSMPRQYYLPSLPVQIVKRVNITSSPVAVLSTPESQISFRTNRSVWISSIGLTPSYSEAVSVKVKIEITQRIKENAGDHNSQDVVVISKAKQEVAMPCRAACMHVSFWKPVKINGGDWYTVSVFVRPLQGTYKLPQYTLTDYVTKILCGADVAEVGEGDQLLFEFEEKMQPQVTEIGYQLED